MLGEQAVVSNLQQSEEHLKMKRALLVIDVQNEYFTGKLPVSYPQNSLERIIQAMNAAHVAEIPIVLI